MARANKSSQPDSSRSLDKKLLYCSVLPLSLMVILAMYFWPAPLGGQTTYLVLVGQSMIPVIEPGSFVIVRADSQYREGDVVAFVDTVDNNRQVVHRIIEMLGGRYVTKGDNNLQADSYIVQESDILGRAVFAVPYIGNLVVFFGSPAGVMANVAFLGLFLFISYRKKRMSRAKKQAALDREPQHLTDSAA